MKRQTLDSGSDHDLTVCGFKPRVGLLADRAEPAWESLSLLLGPSPARALSLSKQINKLPEKIKKLKRIKQHLTFIEHLRHARRCPNHA